MQKFWGTIFQIFKNNSDFWQQKLLQPFRENITVVVDVSGRTILIRVSNRDSFLSATTFAILRLSVVGNSNQVVMSAAVNMRRIEIIESPGFFLLRWQKMLNFDRRLLCESNHWKISKKSFLLHARFGFLIRNPPSAATTTTTPREKTTTPSSLSLHPYKILFSWIVSSYSSLERRRRRIWQTAKVFK